MSLPLLLAGPILRRVEPALVSVWAAFSEPVRVRLLVWEGRAESGRPDPFSGSQNTPTLRVGANLHLVQVTSAIPVSDAKSFQADALYSYDLQITPGSGTVQTLASLGMLQAVEPEDGQGHKQVPRVPLGFEPNLLPSFAPPPSELGNLNLLYGSCRRPGHPDP